MTMAKDMPMQDSLEQVLLLKKREQNLYQYANFYRPQAPVLLDGKSRTERLSLKDDSNGSRTKICSWTFNIVDHFGISRETALISMDILDRFMATHGGEASPQFALLTAITAMYISIKVHSRITMTSDSLAALSREQFTASDIEQMEVKVLKGIQWLINPPTTISFLSLLISILPENVSTSTRNEIFEKAQYIAELAAFDPYFVEHQSSTIAVACILSSIDNAIYFGQISSSSRETFLVALNEQGMSENPEAKKATDRLRETISVEELEDDRNYTNKRKRDASSPISVICKHFS